MSSGALTPGAAVDAIYHDGLHHLDEPSTLAFIKNIAGSLQLTLAGLAGVLIAGGCPGIRASNPGMVDFIQGSIFATGLVSVYFTGAELVTGYPMWLSIAALKRKRRPMAYVKAIMSSFLGNLVGALIVSGLFSVATEAVSEEPVKGFLIEEVEKLIVDKPWHTVFLKATACGYLVTLAMLLGTQNMDGVSKALALWLPFAIASISQFPHTVKFMHLAPTAMMLGARLSFAGFWWKCMLPIALGNAVGGALFTGVYHWWVFLYLEEGQEKVDVTFREAVDDFRDEDD